MAERPQSTKTTHPLPFNRLSPVDFERLCLWLVRREGYKDAEHFGAKGDDQGRDVVAWRYGLRVVFQCKRVKQFQPAEAEEELAKLLELPAETRPRDVVFVVTATVTAETRDRAKGAWGGRGSCHFWSGTELDERVKRHREILEEFFEPSKAGSGFIVRERGIGIAGDVAGSQVISGDRVTVNIYSGSVTDQRREERSERHKHLVRYADDESEELSGRLKDFYSRRKKLMIAGEDTRLVEGEILDVKRLLRKGPQLQAGEFLLDGRYELLEPLGKGGFATVWKAWENEADRLVALKILHGHLCEDRSRRERFFRGARKMAELVHPHIVRVYGSGFEDDGWYFFAMEYLPSSNFEKAVLAGRLTLEERLRIVLETGAALAHAHQAGVVHRDVKPSNILLDDEGRSKLSDFDLVWAEDTTALTATHAMMGTVQYAAPEALNSARRVGPSADIYSLASTAIFALRGAQLPAAYYRDPKQIVAELAKEEELRSVLIRGTEPDRDKRFKSAADFCEALAVAMLRPEKSPELKVPHEEPPLTASVDKPQLARHRAFGALLSDWQRIVERDDAPTKKGLEANYLDLGRQLGKCDFAPDSEIKAFRSKIETLRSGALPQLRDKLRSLDLDLDQTLGRHLPRLFTLRKTTLERDRELTTLTKITYPLANLIELLFFAILSTAPILAELSLATEITQFALRLQEPLWIAVALTATTLAFKLLADDFFGAGESRSKSQSIGRYGYIGVVIALWSILLLPTSSLRTEQVLRFHPVVGENQWGSTQSSQPELTEPISAADRRSFRLFWSFYLAAMLFPMLSGVGFSRLFLLLRHYLEDRMARAKWKEVRREVRRDLNGIEREIQHHTEGIADKARQKTQILAVMGSNKVELHRTAQGFLDAIASVDTAASRAVKQAAKEMLDEPTNARILRVQSKASRLLQHDEVGEAERFTISFYLAMLGAVTDLHGKQDTLTDISSGLGDEVEFRLRAGYDVGVIERHGDSADKGPTLVGVVDKLVLVERRAFSALQEDWERTAERGEVTADYLDSSYFDLGCRLGELGVAPEYEIRALRSKAETLQTTMLQQLCGKLQILDLSLAQSLGHSLFRLFALRKGLRAQDRKFSKGISVGHPMVLLLETIFFSLLSIALIAAELSLAKEATQFALLLQRPFWFALALTATTLAFKLLADDFFGTVAPRTKEHDIGRYTLISTVALMWAVLMFPLTSLRTEQILRVYGEIEEGRAAGENLEWEPSQPSPANGDPLSSTNPNSLPLSDQQPSPGQRVEDTPLPGASSINTKGRRYSRLFWSFYLSALAFPMLGGVGFSRSFTLLRNYLKCREARSEWHGEREKVRLALEEVQRQIQHGTDDFQDKILPRARILAMTGAGEAEIHRAVQGLEAATVTLSTTSRGVKQAATAALVAPTAEEIANLQVKTKRFLKHAKVNELERLNISFQMAALDTVMGALGRSKTLADLTADLGNELEHRVRTGYDVGLMKRSRDS